MKPTSLPNSADHVRHSFIARSGLPVMLGTVSLLAMGTAAMAWPTVKSAIAPTSAVVTTLSPAADPAMVATFVGMTTAQMNERPVNSVMVMPLDPVNVAQTETPILAAQSVAAPPRPAARVQTPQPRPAAAAPRQVTIAPVPVSASAQTEVVRPRLINRWSSGEFR